MFLFGTYWLPKSSAMRFDEMKTVFLIRSRVAFKWAFFFLALVYWLRMNFVTNFNEFSFRIKKNGYMVTCRIPLT